MSNTVENEVNGVKYKLPKVFLLNESGIGVAEIAARTCYDSFENSENECIAEFDAETIGKMNGSNIDVINNIASSELLTQLAWVHHHHSIIEHTSLSFLIKGTSRGVLQEHARHRIQSISVRSTRYTMSDVINAYIACYKFAHDYNSFFKIMIDLDMFVTSDAQYNNMEIKSIWDKITYQVSKLGLNEFLNISLSKENIELYYRNTCNNAFELYNVFKAGKKKRNVGDAFKHVVSDNWKVDMVVTFNLRSLKNYFDLRDSGAAYFQIRWLAEGMKSATPEKYLKLIDKRYK